MFGKIFMNLRVNLRQESSHIATT